jgi:hypothetical protein
MHRAALFFVSVLSLLYVQVSPAQTYTIQQLATNNTSACSSSSYAPLGVTYCADGFPGNYYVNEDSSYFSQGWVDDQWNESNNTIAPVLTAVHNPSPAPPASGAWNLSLWNISQGRSGSSFNPTQATAPTDMHALTLRSGQSTASTKVVAELQGWFCDGEHWDSGLDCLSGGTLIPVNQDQAYDDGNMYINLYEGHAYVSYTTWYQPTTDVRAVNMWDRGVDIGAFDWYGGPNDCPPQNATSYALSQYTNACGTKFGYADAGYRDMVNSIRYTLPAQRAGANMTFFLIMDQGAWDAGACNTAGQNEPWCATNKIISDLLYAETNYVDSPSYNSVGGLPVIGFFQDESDYLAQCTSVNNCRYDDQGHTCTSQSSCFKGIYDTVTTWLNNQGSPFGNNHYYRIFAEDAGCPKAVAGHPDSDGCYMWVKPYKFGNSSNVTTTNQLWSANAQTALDTFYNDTKNGLTGANHQPALIMGSAFKGFDDYETGVGWFQDRIITQGCGTTWLNTFNEPKKYFTTTPIPYMMVATWDDYEEGTEIETGISNCLEDSSFVLQPVT